MIDNNYTSTDCFLLLAAQQTAFWHSAILQWIAGLGLPSAGGSEVCTLHPLDVIKTRLMAQTSGRPSGNPDRNLRCGGNSTDNMELREFHRKGSQTISKKMVVAKRAS